ncbi:MAG: hypothetical protein MJ070_10975, partial [Lachnospiraceae bacterium]|nr:hypothetical protein [Lachnospiraceae bacterium]
SMWAVDRFRFAEADATAPYLQRSLPGKGKDSVKLSLIDLRKRFRRAQDPLGFRFFGTAEAPAQRSF